MKDSILTSTDFFKIDETSKFLLGGLWEQIYLINKTNGQEILLGDFDGVTEVGIISKINDWAITANDKILIWKNGEIITIDKEELKIIENIKLVDENIVELFVDTLNLNNNKSIWHINMQTLELTKKE